MGIEWTTMISANKQIKTGISTLNTPIPAIHANQKCNIGTSKKPTH
jgi:hypothetical protein